MKLKIIGRSGRMAKNDSFDCMTFGPSNSLEFNIKKRGKGKAVHRYSDHMNILLARKESSPFLYAPFEEGGVITVSVLYKDQK